jgi:hypothetical protein
MTMAATTAHPRTQAGAGRPGTQAGAGRLRQLRRRARFALAACALAALVACGGGGGGTAGVGMGGTGSFAVGSIDGFGSIQVNGLRFDTAAARVTDANAADPSAPLRAEQLQLGMTVEVLGSLNPNTNRGSAGSVVIAAEMKGVINAVDVNVNGGTLQIFGRTVRVTLATVFAGEIDQNGALPIQVTRLGQLAAGHVVEVYGLPQPDGSLRATRIEFEAVDVGAFVAEYGSNERFHVEGLLTDLVGVAHTRTFRVAGVAFRETPDRPLPANLSNNTEVTVSFAPTTAAAPFDALALRVESRVFPAGKGLAEIEGLVSGLTTSPEGVSTFRLNGFPVRVNATGVTFEFDGLVQPALTNGVRVEVYGNIVAGVLVATKVEFEDEEEDEDPFEFAGLASCTPTPCAAGAGTFTLRGITFAYDATTQFVGGATPATLDGMRVEVYAKVQPSTGAGAGTTFIATKIERDD